MIIESVYVDTSAFYALMDRSDTHHHRAKTLWPSLLEDNVNLQTSNYVVCETLDRIQCRLGFNAASLWHKDVLGIMEVHWVDQATHRRAHDLWMSLGRQQNSLVDCISFTIMHKNQIEKSFCFKGSYIEQGFISLAYMEDATSRPAKEKDKGPRPAKALKVAIQP